MCERTTNLNHNSEATIEIIGKVYHFELSVMSMMSFDDDGRWSREFPTHNLQQPETLCSAKGLIGQHITQRNDACEMLRICSRHLVLYRVTKQFQEEEWL